MIIAGKSVNLPQYPENKDVVRAQTFITGYYVREVNKSQTEVHFLAESDFGLSMVIMKQIAPKSTNYPEILR